MELITTLVLGILPEVLYFYLFIKNILKINKKKTLLFLLVFIAYMISTYTLNYNLYLYILFYVISYFGLKLFYKTKITDLFLIIYLELYLYLTSCFCYFIIPNYTIAFVINRILLFIPLIFKKKLIILYDNYKTMWNRNDNKNFPIKSLTLRNISLVVMNILILLGYLTLLFLSK